MSENARTTKKLTEREVRELVLVGALIGRCELKSATLDMLRRGRLLFSKCGMLGTAAMCHDEITARLGLEADTLSSGVEVNPTREDEDQWNQSVPDYEEFAQETWSDRRLGVTAAKESSTADDPNPLACRHFGLRQFTESAPRDGELVGAKPQPTNHAI